MSHRLTASLVLQSARSFGFASLSAGSGALLLVLLVVAGRLLGDEAYGRFSFALALATILETLVDFGLKEVTARTVARDRGEAARLVSNTFGLKLLLGLTACGVVALVAVLLRPEPEVRAACVLLGLSSAIRSFLLTLRHTFNGLERYDLESAVVTADRAFLLGFGLIALLGNHGVVGLSLAFVAGRLAAFALALTLARRHIGPLGVELDLPYWRSLQRAAMPFGTFVAVLNLYAYVDTLMLGVLRTDAETGLYNAAYRIYEGFTNVAVVLATVAGPKLSRYFVSDRERHAAMSRLTVASAAMMALPVGVAGILGARWVLALLFGPEFAAAERALQILSAGLVVVFPLQLMHSVAISANQERVLVKAATAGFVLNVVANAIAIPWYGRNGSAAATVLSEAVSLAWIAVALIRAGRRY